MNNTLHLAQGSGAWVAVQCCSSDSWELNMREHLLQLIGEKSDTSKFVWAVARCKSIAGQVSKKAAHSPQGSRNMWSSESR